MATFEVQIEGLTGLAITDVSNPARDELTEFLKDGVNEVTIKTVQDSPELFESFQRESAIQNNNGLDLSGAQIIAVLRENNADGSSDGTTAWYSCNKIPVTHQSRVIDTTSLHYSSKLNPSYLIDNSGINVYPVPDDTDDGYKVYYINNVPTDLTNEASLTYAHSDIKYFPSDKVYLVVIYAAIKALEAKMAEYTVDEEDVELVQAISYNIKSLTDQYDTGFKNTETKALAAKAAQGGS